MAFLISVAAAWVMGATFVMTLVTYWNGEKGTSRLNRLWLILACLFAGWALTLFLALDWLTDSPEQ